MRVVTDSTADLPQALARQWGITVVPLSVQFGEEAFRDGVDLGPEEFYRRLAGSTALPHTSQPSPGAFAQVYEALARGGHDVLSIHISSKLSGTYEAALRGREVARLEGKVEVVDSRLVSLGLGLAVLEAARAAGVGASLEEVGQVALQAIPRVRLACLLDTLEYLRRGGRIGKAAAFLGSFLQIKPIVTLRDGEVHPLERARTWPRGQERLCHLVSGCRNIAEMGVVYSTGQEEAEALAKRLEAHISQGSIIIGQFGPVLGTYVGPGALGVVWREGP
ncbi:MAG: DegV family protein [Chloroflexi bacterium]|nr:DegV family protein [Chloroflexota bacterium]